jgi:hypothetical protein
MKTRKNKVTRRTLYAQQSIARHHAFLGKRDGWTSRISIWTSLVATAISIGALVFNYVTVREMQAQREFTYRPLLSISETAYFYIYWQSGWHSEPRFPYSFSWSNKKDKKPTTIDHFEGLLELSNIGSGVADQITATWLFDIKAMIELINQNDSKTAPASLVMLGRLPMLVYKTKTNDEWSALQMSWTTDHILPASHDTARILLPLPDTYVSLLSIYFAQVPTRGIFSQEMEELKFGDLYLDLKYYDLAHRQFHLYYEVSLTGHSVRKGYQALNMRTSKGPQLLGAVSFLTFQIQHKDFVTETKGLPGEGAPVSAQFHGLRDWE